MTEIPAPVPVVVPDPARPAERARAGRFAPGPRTSAAAARGGRAKAEKARAKASTKGALKAWPELQGLALDENFGRCWTEGEAFASAVVRDLAGDAGGFAGVRVVSVARLLGVHLAIVLFLTAAVRTQAFAWLRSGDDGKGGPTRIEPRLDLIAALERASEKLQRTLVLLEDLAARAAVARRSAPDPALRQRLEGSRGVGGIARQPTLTTRAPRPRRPGRPRGRATDAPPSARSRVTPARAAAALAPLTSDPRFMTWPGPTTKTHRGRGGALQFAVRWPRTSTIAA